MDYLCYLCLMFVMPLHLFIAALWSPAGKGLTSWISFLMFNCVSVTFPCGILGQVWYSIVSISDLCHLSYFDVSKGGSFIGICCFLIFDGSVLSNSYRALTQYMFLEGDVP